MIELISHGALDGRALAAGTITMAAGHADATDAGLAHIEVSGNGTLDLLAIAGIARGSKGILTTRLAALRVTIAWQRAPETARIAVDRFSADYLWEWLAAKARIEAGVGISS